ncbi:MAG: hypothetical protein ABJF10_08115 [Chthoniobacter sp.]|uniref:hypothetical protein n=1 Tax=Chthoniobacter sp. TaxID=2510640 RepID=UPI0032A1E0E5
MIHSLPAREPTRLFLHLLPCLALAVCCTVLFWWNPFGKPPEKAWFEASVVSEKPGTVAFHFDVDGSGLRFGRTEPVKVPGGRGATHVRFAMPAGKLCAVNFVPRVEGGIADIREMWLTSESGEVIAMFPPSVIVAANPKFAELLPNGVLRFHSQPQEEKNGLQFRPEPPLEMAIEMPPPAWQVCLVFAFSLALTLWLSMKFGDRLAVASWIPRLADWARAHPVWALFCAAAFSVMVCCHPVIFCGKSFVSPDNGLLLLYEGKPTVPGGAGGHIDNAVGSDLGATMLWNMPASMIQHRALFQDHEFPLWSRYNWSGLPLFAQSLSMIGDPLEWPAILTGGASWAWDWKFITAQVLFAFAIGLLVRRTSGSLAAALLLTLSAPFMGFFAYRYNHPAFFSLCYSPWILLAWIEGARAPTLRGAALWSFFLIFADWWELNSGTAKEMSALLLFMNTAGGLMLLLAAQPLRWRLQRLAVFAWANVIFLLLSAPLWMTFLDALGKAHTSYDEPRIYQMTPGLALGLFDDIFHRQLMPIEFLFNPSTNFFVLIGAAWALVRVRALAGERMLWAVTLPAVVAGALAFGVVSPATAATIPFLKNIYHFDNTFSCVLFILLFVIAGYGLRECLARMRDKEWLGDFALMLTFVGVLVASYFGLTDAAHRVGRTLLKVGESIPLSAFFVGYVPALFAALLILPWAARQALLRRPAAAAWGVVALAALATLHFRHGMYLETKFDFYTRNPKTRTDLRHLTSPALEAVRTASTEPGRVVGLDWEMVPGFNTVLGFETISGPEALMNPAMLELTSALGLKRIWDWRIKVKEEEFTSVHRALDMLNVRYILAEPGQSGPIPSGTKVLSASDLTVLQSETAWPRAFFTDTVGVYKDGPGLRKLVEEGDGRPFAVEPAPLQAMLKLPARDLAQRVVQPAHNYKLTNNTTSFEIEAPSAGLAVLSEAYVPNDILAYVDDQPVLCVPVDHAFRGVRIDQPGHHVVRFEYWPAVLDGALNVALVGLVALALSLWWWRRSGQAVAKTPSTEPAPPECAAVS